MAEVDLVFDPANFVGGKITDPNPFFPLARGNKWVYEEEDGPTVTEKVIGKTKTILGVKCTVVKVIEKEDGEVIEKTKDYYAQDTDGNVWYFGEDTKAKLEEGGFTTEGSWRAGVDGAVPGIIMLANPQIGDTYDQEGAPGIAEDRAEVKSLTASASVPFGDFNGVCLQTEDLNPLENSLENKFMAPGIGVVMTQGVTEPGDEELVSFTTKSGTVNLAHLTQAMASFGQPQFATGTALASNGTDDPSLNNTLTASTGSG